MAVSRYSNTRLYLMIKHKKRLTKLLDSCAGTVLSVSSATEHVGVTSVQFSSVQFIFPQYFD